MSDQKKTEYETDADGLPRRVSAAEKRKRQQGQKPSTKPAPRKRNGKKVTDATDASSGTVVKLFECDLPGGGSIALTNPLEVDYYKSIKKRYMDEYPLTKPNDLSRLSQLLILELHAYRMMQRMMGQVPQFDQQGKPTGKFIAVPEEEIADINDRLPKVQTEIRNLEKALKIDKTAREGDGAHDIANYFETLKRAALDYGVHISERYTLFDEIIHDLMTKIRILDNADEEDRKYHDISETSIITYIRNKLAEVEAADQKFAADKQAAWVGKL